MPRVFTFYTIAPTYPVINLQIPTTIKPAKPSLQRSYFDETPDWSRIATAPSIPANNQCYGYEESSDGNLIMQRPVKAGFKGSHNDSVGPMDYKVGV